MCVICSIVWPPEDSRWDHHAGGGVVVSQYPSASHLPASEELLARSIVER